MNTQAKLNKILLNQTSHLPFLLRNNKITISVNPNSGNVKVSAKEAYINMESNDVFARPTHNITIKREKATGNIKSVEVIKCA